MDHRPAAPALSPAHTLVDRVRVIAIVVLASDTFFQGVLRRTNVLAASMQHGAAKTEHGDFLDRPYARDRATVRFHYTHLELASRNDALGARAAQRVDFASAELAGAAAWPPSGPAQVR